MSIHDVTANWVPLPGYTGIYEINLQGQVKRIKAVAGTSAGRILKDWDARGYRGVWLCDGGQKKFCMVHRLLMEAFIGPCPPGYQVNHKNGVKDDNRLENLEYVTPSQNIQHSYDVMGRDKPMGETHHNAKLTDNQVNQIRQLLMEGQLLHREIAAQFTVSRSLIGGIKNGKKRKEQ
jgi:hypothetical protein